MREQPRQSAPASGGPATSGGGADKPLIGSLCTGYGGLDLAVLAVLGGRLCWTAETDRHASAILAARFPHAPNLGDITMTALI
jgi:site-specific DNA-cytosine methylase